MNKNDTHTLKTLALFLVLMVSACSNEDLGTATTEVNGETVDEAGFVKKGSKECFAKAKEFCGEGCVDQLCG